MAIVDLRSGRALTAREIKASVMAARGWTSEQYQKQYDILRNKTRNYEKLTGQPAGSIKVNELLYTQTKAQKRYGANYRPSKQLEAIQATPSASTGKFSAATASRAVISKQERILKSQVLGFTSRSTEGAEILRAYERQKSGYYDAEIERLADEFAEAIDAGEVDLAGQLRQEMRDLTAEQRNAPRTLAELRQQLDSAAKSLRQYQKNKRDEWKRKNPDAPASYAVGTP